MNSLQVFRGLAALAVVAHHAALSTNAFVELMPSDVYSLFEYGALGVDFFFVLSGFIITWAHFDVSHGKHAINSYLVKRVARIFPAYLPVGVAMLMLYTLMPNLSAAGGARNISVISSIFLVPSSGSPALSVAWTLVHEVLFYGVFAVYFFSRKIFVVGLVCWVLAILFARESALHASWLRYPLSLLNLEFLIGGGAAWLIKAKDVRIARVHSHWFILLGILFALVALTQLDPRSVDAARILFAGALALLVVGFATRDLRQKTHWPGALLILGNASYSIYLVHNPLLSLSQRLLAGVGFNWWLALVSGSALGVTAGLIYFKLVEQPARRFAQSRLNK